MQSFLKNLKNTVDGNIIIQGDFNAHTNTQPDIVEFDNETKRVNLDDSDYHCDTIMSRNNLDYQHTNNNGHLLLNLCKETRIRILNERTTCDLNGQATCISFKNCNSHKLDPLPGTFLLTDDAITFYTENIQSNI
jgi:hypothetical protein